MHIEIYHLFLLATAGAGQTILVAFTWGFFVAVLLIEPLTVPYSLALLMYENPSETTLIVTLIGTVLSVATTSCFSIALKEALRHRTHKPIKLIELLGGIALAKGEFFVSFRHRLTTLVTIGMFALTKLLVSSWATLLTPTLVALNATAVGMELDLGSSYFESRLGEQLVSSGSALLQGNSIEIFDNDGLLSGIATAQHSFGVSGVLNFNGVLYNVSTGGVIPVAPEYLGSMQHAQPNNTGLSFVGGYVPIQVQFPSSQALFDNYTILQQGLTADVTCTQIDPQSIPSPQSAQVSIDVFTGSITQLEALAYNISCNQGNPATQDYVIQQSNQVGAAGLLYSLVCPYPVGQSNLDWTTFNVTSAGTGKYEFMQSTTCEITPKLTTSLVTYASGTLNATVVNSASLSPQNKNLALFLASIVNYQSSNSQGLVANSIGDALYSIAVTTNTSLNNGGTMDPRLIKEMEQYWRGVVEFFGTYLRCGFSAYPISIPSDGLSTVHGTHTIVTMGWSKRSPTYLYTVFPLTLFALLTYATIGYALWHILVTRTTRCQYATFDPTNPLHLIMVSSTRVPGGKDNLEGETIGKFNSGGIQDNEDLRVQLNDTDERKRFKCTYLSHNG
ncbi:hypothetical protein EV363DRAFT_1530794 [Boletus edulis]|nr:hypothetical protein EV363DRAFT_1530794 [Boletus edulis]